MIRIQKVFIVLTVFFSGMLLFAGCAAQQPKPGKPAAPAQCIPEWEINPPSAEDGIYGTGLAKMKLAALSKKTADARARDEVVQAIQVKVQTMLKDFMQESGIENAQSLQFVQSVSKQVASNVLSGCRITKRKVCPDGTWHSLALYSNNLAAELKEQLKTQSKKMIENEEALYNEFKAKNAFEDLDKELDKLDLSEE
ncbi:MAG: hypothetical protein PVI90_09440 [Desulfobacteraceae bacterium]|jgi:hypothetical protein